MAESKAMSLADIEAQEAAMNSEVMAMDLGSDLADMDINVEEIDFNEVDDDLKKFQEDEIVKDALQRGVDLGDYARQIETELKRTEKDSVSDYLKESGDVADLHMSIKSCDSVLERMEHMLTKFQADLGKVSSEIKHLQDKSMLMRVKLKNRKSVHKDLDHYVRSIYVSPKLIQSIYEAEIKDQYIEHLKELDSKLRHLQDLKNTKKLDQAAKDMLPLVQRAQVKAVSRIRQFLLQRIYLLKKPQTNIQIKQNLLLRFNYLYQFCKIHDREVSEEIRTIYIETIHKIYSQHFKQYLVSLMKLQAASVVTKADLLGVDEAKSGGMFSLRKSSLHLERVFMLGNRNAILSNIDKPPIIYHSAAKRNHKFPYQEIFRTTHRLLMDTATTETAFVGEFFSDGKDAKVTAKKEQITFESIFGKITQLFIENLEHYLNKSYDCLEILILIRVVTLHTQMMRHRQTECLDPFFDRINMLLWPRFKVILDAHLASVKSVKANSVRRGTTTPFFLAHRYGEFASGIDALNKDYNDAIITSNMGRLRDTVCDLLERMANCIGDKTMSVVFLINNYDSILKVFDDKNLDSETAKDVKGRMHGHVAKYVEAGLQEKFSKLITFVRAAEKKVNDALESKKPLPSLDLESAAEIVRTFAKHWQRNVQQIDTQVSNHFGSDSATTPPGTTYKAPEILRQILIQLVLYYQRLQAVIKKCYGRRQPGFMKELIPNSTIMHEIKKYTSA
mmetsp:Transcript_7199/g.17520  ORF Transcript_7199/g.17520 Transcript_7199/m.17520 type:complete len:731 (-) Transcript_7199:191-2383(-)